MKVGAHEQSGVIIRTLELDKGAGKGHYLKLLLNALLGSHHLAYRNAASSVSSSRCPTFITTSTWWGILGEFITIKVKSCCIKQQFQQEQDTITVTIWMYTQGSHKDLVLFSNFLTYNSICHIHTKKTVELRKSAFISIQTIKYNTRSILWWTDPEAAAVNSSTVVCCPCLRKKLNSS